MNQPRPAFTASSLIRTAKAALVFSMGLFALLAGVGNLLDPDPNMQFVVHVLPMAINPPTIKAITAQARKSGLRNSSDPSSPCDLIKSTG